MINPDLEFTPDVESVMPDVTMAIGSPSIPDFMESAGGCNDPNTVKVAILDGGIQKSHPDFPYCSRGFCEGRRFMNPTNQDWGISTNNHGNHVMGVSVLARASVFENVNHNAL